MIWQEVREEILHHLKWDIENMAHHHSSRKLWISRQSGIIKVLWDSFWNPPESACPKCGSRQIEFYDPFFFAPIRTLTGKRRIKCINCRFIWRPSRHGKSVWDRFKPVM